MSSRLTFGLIAANFVLLLLVAGYARGAVGAAPATQPVVRAEVIELVDKAGVVRAHLATMDDGEVVLRLRDQDGNIRVKLGAGRDGSGLLLADDTSEVGVHMLSGISRLTSTRDTKITLASPGGIQHVIRPTGVSARP